MTLRMSSAPHIHSGENTRRIMADVLIALVPCVMGGIYFFGLRAALIISICMFTCVLSEFVWFKLSKRPSQVSDLSAMVTGVILGLNLPVGVSWWVAVIGSVVAILLVKQIFGGIGDNFVNPALAARAVLLASWPVQMTSYVMPINSPFGVLAVDATTSATPLMSTLENFSIFDRFIGNIPGSIGEVSKMLILLGFVYLLIRKVITPIIPLCMLAGTALLTFVLGGDPLVEVLSGGLLFGAVFMATDYTTSPMTLGAQAIFAFCAGLLVAVIREFGSYPEGVTYAILMMNIITPLLDKYMKPKLYGKPQKEAAAKEA